jgi:hypothetical protein
MLPLRGSLSGKIYRLPELRHFSRGEKKRRTGWDEAEELSWILDDDD